MPRKSKKNSTFEPRLFDTSSTEEVFVEVTPAETNLLAPDPIRQEILRRELSGDFVERMHAIIYHCDLTLKDHWPQKPDDVPQHDWETVLKRVPHVAELSEQATPAAKESLFALHEVKACDERLRNLGSLAPEQARDLSVALCHAINLGRALQRLHDHEQLDGASSSLNGPADSHGATAKSKASSPAKRRRQVKKDSPTAKKNRLEKPRSKSRTQRDE